MLPLPEDMLPAAMRWARAAEKEIPWLSFPLVPPANVYPSG